MPVPAPLRSWTDAATGPDGRRWSVVVSVPYGDNTLDAGEAEHHIAVRPSQGVRRPALYTHRVKGEAAADSLVAVLRDAIATGWRPGYGDPPGTR